MHEINRIEATYRRLRGEGREVLRLFSGNPNEHGIFFPPEILSRAYQGYFQRQCYEPNPKGLAAAREAIAAFYRDSGIELNPEHMLITSGSSESFLHLFFLLGTAGGNFLVPQPSYPLFDSIAELAKVELRHYPLDEAQDWKIDLQGLQARIDRQTRAIILVSPHNPTGAVHSAEELQAVVEIANESNLPLICDEVFSEFYFGEGQFPRAIGVAKPKLCFTLNGISKLFALPALKLSWIAVSGEAGRVERALDRLELLVDTFLTCHTPIQAALPALFSQGEGFLHSYREQVRNRRDLALKLLQPCPGVSVVPPRGGFYLIGRVDKKTSLIEEDWVIALMESTGVFLHPGYFYDQEAGIHFVLSFLTEPHGLKAGLKRLAAWL